MQAHPQSTSAARALSSNPSPTPSRAGSTIQPTARENACALANSAGLAHDAGNFLGGLRLYCGLLERPGVLSPQHRHYATELRLLADRSTRLIERLLAHVGGDHLIQPPTDLRPDNASPDCAAALHELAPLLRRMVGPDTRIELDSPPHLPSWAFAPPFLTAEALERIVVNLVCNAARALATAQRSGLIRIVLHPAAGHLRLLIQDNGPGLARGVAESFLTPSPTPTRARRGLGHRIVHELTQSTAGVLSIDSVAGLGTIFTLQWTQPASSEAPIVRPPAGPPPAAAKSASTRTRLARSGDRSTTAPQNSQEDSVDAC